MTDTRRAVLDHARFDGTKVFGFAEPATDAIETACSGQRQGERAGEKVETPEQLFAFGLGQCAGQRVDQAMHHRIEIGHH